MTANLRNDLRLRYKAIRSALDDDEQRVAAAQLLHQLTKLDVVKQSTTVAVYLPVRGEISLHPFINWSWVNEKTLCLPILHPFNKRHLLFQRYQSYTEMKHNRLAIDEPVLACNQVIPVNDIDAILLPLVAFDNDKNRLGMGGGFYDTTLAHIRTKKQRAALIGVAHCCQYHDNRLPIEAWDIPLDWVVTPSRIV